MPDDLFNRSSASISPCGLYRYRLERRWRDDDQFGPLFLMLNPSTADANVDDPTIRRCIGFARSWGYGRMGVVNLFAFRATKPNDLLRADDPVGPENDDHICDALAHSDFVICAWGAHKFAEARARDFMKILKTRNTLAHCLGVTKAGAPRHPLYVKGDVTPEIYRART